MLFVFGIAIILGRVVQTGLNEDIQNDDYFDDNAKALAARQASDYTALWDNVFFVAVVFFWIMLILTSFFINSHPAFFILTALLLIFVFIAAAYVSNGYAELITDDDLVTAASGFSKMDFVFRHFVLTVCFIAGTTGLALYAKAGGGAS